MKVIDMHCDTISKLYQERDQQNISLRNNPFQVDLIDRKSVV